MLVGLLRRLHVGPDPAVPEQIDGSLEDPTDQLRRRHAGGRLRRDPKDRADLGRGRHALRRSINHAAALREDRSVVVVPRRAGQLEQPLAFRERGGRVGVRVEEDVPVVERRDELDRVRVQHAVAEDIA